MLKKWYISTFVVLLTLLGVVCEKQIAVPNQEIVLEFTNKALTTQYTESTIAIVKKQLQDIGVVNIQVKKSKNGSLKLTYYSDADVKSIQNSFSKNKVLAADFLLQNESDKSSELPIDDTTVSCNIAVYEIQKNNKTGWDFNGVNVSELDLKSDHLFEPSVCFSNLEFNIKNNNNAIKEALKVSRNIVVAINNTSHKIPEGRAGPNC